MRRFEDRVGFVTGAAHGIGAAIAGRLAAEGARLAVADLDENAVQELADRLRDSGTDVLALRCDVTDTDSVAAAVSATHQRFGRLDVLVNNAGGGSGTPFEQTTDEEWRGQTELNLGGAVRCIRAALAHLVGAPAGGSVVSVSSVNGLTAFGDIAYATAKAGLHNLTANLAAEYGHRGVRFNAVAPGTIRTRVWAGRDDMLDRIAGQLPLRRVGLPADIAAAVAFLASDDAAWITGEVLRVDGGALAGPLAWFSDASE
jgi:meso-butanediol dehydrogenase / (S,S)-butanediol dehydrogenase / diacetyl reductase